MNPPSYKPRKFWIADTERYGHVNDNFSPICGEDPKDSAVYEGNTLHVIEYSAYEQALKERDILIQLKSDLQDVCVVMMSALERIEEDSCDYNHDDLASEAIAYTKKILSQ